MMKKILSVIFEPFKNISSKGLSEALFNLFNKNKFIIYILAILTTTLIIFINYFI